MYNNISFAFISIANVISPKVESSAPAKVKENMQETVQASTDTNKLNEPCTPPPKDPLEDAKYFIHRNAPYPHSPNAPNSPNNLYNVARNVNSSLCTRVQVGPCMVVFEGERPPAPYLIGFIQDTMRILNNHRGRKY